MNLIKRLSVISAVIAGITVFAGVTIWQYQSVKAEKLAEARNSVIQHCNVFDAISCDRPAPVHVHMFSDVYAPVVLRMAVVAFIIGLAFYGVHQRRKDEEERAARAATEAA